MKTKNKLPKISITAGVCRFCGQLMIGDSEFKTAGQANEWASKNCGCDDARKYAREVREKEERKKNIARTKEEIAKFAEYCEARGTTLTPNVYDTVKLLAIRVHDRQIIGASVSFGQIKAGIGKSKGKIVITFSYSDKRSSEV